MNEAVQAMGTICPFFQRGGGGGRGRGRGGKSWRQDEASAREEALANHNPADLTMKFLDRDAIAKHIGNIWVHVASQKGRYQTSIKFYEVYRQQG